jgi:hypothetical protein
MSEESIKRGLASGRIKKVDMSELKKFQSAITEAALNEAADKSIANHEHQKKVWERTRGEMEVSAVAAYAIADAMKSWSSRPMGNTFGFLSKVAKEHHAPITWIHATEGQFMSRLEEAHDQNEPVVVKFDQRYLTAHERKLVTAWLDAKYLIPAYVIKPRPGSASEVAQKVVELSDEGILSSIHRNGEIFVFGGDLDELKIYLRTVGILHRWFGQLNVVESGACCLLYAPADMVLLEAIIPGTPHVWYTTCVSKETGTVNCATFESKTDWHNYQIGLLEQAHMVPIESGELYTDSTRTVMGEPRQSQRAKPFSANAIVNLMTKRVLIEGIEAQGGVDNGE